MKAIYIQVFATILFISACSPNQSQKGAPTEAIRFEEFVKLENQMANANNDAADPSCNTSDCQKMRQEFRYVVYVGNQIYCYWDEKRAETRTDFEALAQTLEKSIINGTSKTQYYRTLRLWAAAFHDGHVNVMMGESDRSLIEIYTAPVRLEVLAPATDHEKVIVTEVKGAITPRVGDRPALSVGDEVIAINNLPIVQALDRIELTMSGSTKRMRRFFAARRLVDALGIDESADPITLTVLHPTATDTETRTVELEREALLSPKAGTPAAPATDETGASNFKAVVLAGSVGYLRIDAFTGSQSFYLLDQAMQRLAQTKGLIIDLRRNGGGDQSGNAILARLLPPSNQSLTRYRTSERMSDFVISQRPFYFGLNWNPGSPYAEWHDLQVTPSRPEDRYINKPVVALTSANCFSACDTFTSALKVHHLATIVGEGTGGGTGTPLVFDLPISGFQFRYSVVRGLTAADDPIEGAGTLPDVLIEPSIADRRTGMDNQLVQAVALLTQVQPGTITSVQQLSPIWKQDLNVSPTLADELELKRIATTDEM